MLYRCTCRLTGAPLLGRCDPRLDMAKQITEPHISTSLACCGEVSKASSTLPPGVAAIKPEYLIQKQSAPTSDKHDVNSKDDNSRSDELQLPPAKRVRRRGQNKNRPRPAFIPFSEMLCPSYHHGDGSDASCQFGEECRYMHDIIKYMSTKPPDISDECYVFKTYGRCPYGRACRFGKSHLTADSENVTNESLYDPRRPGKVLNVIPRSLQEKLRKRQIAFVRSEAYLKRLNESKKKLSVESDKLSGTTGEEYLKTAAVCSTDCDVPLEETDVESQCCSNGELLPVEANCMKGSIAMDGDDGVCVQTCGPLSDEDTVRLKLEEKKKVDFRGKLYLAPLTTVGNLPFRRICKEFGADVTCGEMAMCTSLLQGQQSEWALLKRHSSEDLFGVQVCGSHADTMTKCAELINSHTTVDFVDINTGCPIDLVFKKGAGSALMGRHTRFEGIVKGMTEVLDTPLTVKMRTGIYNKNWNAHKLVAKLKDWGVSMLTVHGRSREQRYTKVADWEYIKTCVAAAQPVPLFGNGDVLSFEDYNHQLQTSGVAGIMIARGALIKPWIFTEIKEQRHWDISSSVRLDVLRRYVNYGLEHWGSDAQGVENTRRFLLEWLSFLYRYIPVGVLEQVPQRINQRPPAFVGRDELETLMASNNCKDWVKISEMLLGPVPQNFEFLPKHKANAYS